MTFATRLTLRCQCVSFGAAACFTTNDTAIDTRLLHRSPSVALKNYVNLTNRFLQGFLFLKKKSFDKISS